MKWSDFFQDPKNVQALVLSSGRFIVGCVASYSAHAAHSAPVAISLLAVAGAAFGFQINDPRHVAGEVQTALYTPPPKE